MDGQFNKSYLKIHLNLVNISEKNAMKIVMKDIFLKLILNILKNYITFTMIYLKE